jgi:hypothetical protein
MATEKTTKAAENAAVKKQAKPKTVKIKLPLTRTEKDDVYVGLNGKGYLIKRGVEVEVPYGVAEILEHREKMLSIAMEYEAQAAAPLEELNKQ